VNVDTSWHLDKRVSIANIVSIVIVAGGMVTAWFTLDKRVAITETRLVEIGDRINRNDARWSSELAIIRNTLERIEQKIDRKADK
jgi:hypothetical protein